DSIPVPTGGIQIPPGGTTISPGNVSVPTGGIPVPIGSPADLFFDDEFGADLNNLASTVEVNPVATKRINTIHPQSLIIGDHTSAVQTRSKVNKTPTSESAFISYNEPSLGIFFSLSYDDEFGADLNNLASIVEVNPVATKRINTIHPQSLIIRDHTSAVQT
ncbi:hypothetical protein Tco_0387997, partial [Tanacetum coccineum]